MELYLSIFFMASIFKASYGCSDQSENDSKVCGTNVQFDSIVDMCSSEQGSGLSNTLLAAGGQGRVLCSCDVLATRTTEPKDTKITITYSGDDAEDCGSAIVFRQLILETESVSCNSSEKVVESFPLKIDFISGVKKNSSYCLNINDLSDSHKFMIECQEPFQLPPLPTVRTTTEIRIFNTTENDVKDMKATIISAVIGGVAAFTFVLAVLYLSCRRKRTRPGDKEDLTSHNGRAIGVEIECESNFAEMSEVDSETREREDEDDVSDISLPPPPPRPEYEGEEITHFRTDPFSTKLGDIQEEVSYECDDDGSQYKTRISIKRTDSRGLTEQEQSSVAVHNDVAL